MKSIAEGFKYMPPTEEEIKMVDRLITDAFMPPEVHHLEQTINKLMLNKLDPVWIRAFKIYNKHNPFVGMNCPPCYYKVIEFHIKRNKMAVAHRTETPKTK
ncbi:hypothetical protein LCGC14_0388420 [marine sediment metagenome]|uniref:Uncharacterized protein n=1 Tax=marine sediment metagenome TaxID=412755 RepID=A0A0F9T0A5_9ZZZZ